ncbi:alpha/beta hydrolase [Embleya sp. NBC_00896]|uniref:alpha/beta fold hydrolase n=1 Tax=Embleya sp. NBC_00896 TaxID=2975961 RepID=UPI002F910B2D|nr:alpha/beta hydrolase [Embleya sp. NBC_00896]
MTDAAYVLVPGAGGAAWYWHLVEAELRIRGRDVVAVDLPGEDEGYGLAEYVDLIVAAAAGRERVVLVGQSLGGFSASLACARLPVSVLVLLNAMIPKPGETAGQWWGNTGQDAAMRENDERDGRAVDAGFDPLVYFLHDVPQVVVEDGWSHQRGQSGTVFDTPWWLPAWPDVPTRVLVAREDRFFPVAFQRRVAQERLGFLPDEMPGGHLVALSRPRELADRLEAYRVEAEVREGR